MHSQHRVVIGDSRSLAEIATASVELVVTSPPYWQLKDYGSERQIGFHDSYATYIDHLNLVWSECIRVLRPGCRIAINIGDQFARAAYYGRYKVIPIRTEIVRFLETMGLDFMGSIVWQKFTNSNPSGGGSVMGSFPYPRNGILRLDYEHILIFKKPGKAPRPDAEAKAAGRMSNEEWNTYFSGHWNFPGAKQEQHLASFPEELPKRLIRMFTFPGETVLDPFLGSGTTTLAAARLDRSSWGYEVNPDFRPIIRERVAEVPGIAPEWLVAEPTTDITQLLDSLPYRFQDPVAMTRRRAPSARYRSRVSETIADEEEYHSVQEVISPELVRLGDGTAVRLLGVKEHPGHNGDAVTYLRDLTRGKRVYLRHDKRRFDSDKNLLSYMYLKNRTFVNAHLIKQGFAVPDRRRSYRFKERFIRYADGVVD